MIANLLDMSRIEGGVLKPRTQTVDLTEIVTACIDRASRHFPDVTIRNEVGRTPVLVRADPIFLDRVVTNLIDNAAKATKDEGAGLHRGRVSHRGRSHDGQDHRSRPRRSPDVREQLFYPFYQLSQRHPRLGTGLGLPISRGSCN